MNIDIAHSRVCRSYKLPILRVGLQQVKIVGIFMKVFRKLKRRIICKYIASGLYTMQNILSTQLTTSMLLKICA